MHSVGGLIVLLLVSILAIYKPAGLTPLATRGQPRSLPQWVRISLIAGGVLTLVLAMLVMHGGHGPAMHSLNAPS